MKDDQIHIIEPKKGWQFIDIKELIRYKDLLFFLVVRGIKARYAQSVLGVGWAIIQPLFQTLVFTVIFGNLAKVSSDGLPYAVFSFTAMVPWTYFQGTLKDSANSLVANAGMISKVYFPRLVLPLSAAFNKLLDFLIASVILAGFLIYYQMVPNWTIVYLPLLLLILIMSSLGIGMWLSAMAVQYRDIKHVNTFLVQLLMYGTPVIYSTSEIPLQYQNWYALNPMVGVIEGFRSIFLGTMEFPMTWVGIGFVVSVVLFLTGSLYFRKMERIFADVA